MRQSGPLTQVPFGFYNCLKDLAFSRVLYSVPALSNQGCKNLNEMTILASSEAFVVPEHKNTTPQKSLKIVLRGVPFPYE